MASLTTASLRRTNPGWRPEPAEPEPEPEPELRRAGTRRARAPSDWADRAVEGDVARARYGSSWAPGADRHRAPDRASAVTQRARGDARLRQRQQLCASRPSSPRTADTPPPVSISAPPVTVAAVLPRIDARGVAVTAGGTERRQQREARDRRGGAPGRRDCVGERCLRAIGFVASHENQVREGARRASQRALGRRGGSGQPDFRGRIAVLELRCLPISESRRRGRG